MNLQLSDVGVTSTGGVALPPLHFELVRVNNGIAAAHTFEAVEWVCSARILSVVKLPPFPSDNRGAIRRERESKRLDIRLGSDVDGRWPERPHGLVPECQDLTPSEVARD